MFPKQKILLNDNSYKILQMYESAKPGQQFGWSMKNRVVLCEELTVVNIGCTKTFNCNYLSSQGNFIQYQELNKTVNRREPILELGIIQRFVVEHGLNKEQLQHYSFIKETITTTTNNNHYSSSSKPFCWTITPSRFVEQLHPAVLLNNYTQPFCWTITPSCYHNSPKKHFALYN